MAGVREGCKNIWKLYTDLGNSMLILEYLAVIKGATGADIHQLISQLDVKG